MLDHPNNLKKFVCYFSFLTYYVCVLTESDRCTESDTVVLECVCVCAYGQMPARLSIFF